MPRATKPPRLWLRPGDAEHEPAWIILDAGSQIRTGCGAGDREGAERELERYLARKRRPKGPRHPDRVPVADVLRLYLIDSAPKQARPAEVASRVMALLDHFGDRTLSAITGAECRAYADDRTPGAARRQLEDLRAAIRHYHTEGFLESCPAVVLPSKGEARERWLTRKEAARLLLAAWRARETQRDARTSRRTGIHTARFILVGLYTGTRAGAICAASWDRVDLERGVFYRKAAGERETNKRRPPVPIPPRLLPFLRRWKAEAERELAAAKRERRAPAFGRYVVEWNGKPVARVSKSFRAAVKAAKLRGVSPHTLRHTAATWLMQAGVDIWEASGFLGMTEETLREHYGHHHPDHLRRAALAIGRKRERA